MKTIETFFQKTLTKTIQCNSCGKITESKGVEMDTLGYRGQCSCGKYLYYDSYKIISKENYMKNYDKQYLKHYYSDTRETIALLAVVTLLIVGLVS